MPVTSHRPARAQNAWQRAGGREAEEQGGGGEGRRKGKPAHSVDGAALVLQTSVRQGRPGYRNPHLDKDSVSDATPAGGRKPQGKPVRPSVPPVRTFGRSWPPCRGLWRHWPARGAFGHFLASGRFEVSSWPPFPEVALRRSLGITGSHQCEQTLGGGPMACAPAKVPTSACPSFSPKHLLRRAIASGARQPP